jgi:hypothetical protein
MEGRETNNWSIDIDASWQGRPELSRARLCHRIFYFGFSGKEKALRLHQTMNNALIKG